jgi:hypothetical protein
MNIRHIGDIEIRTYKFYKKLHFCNRLIPDVGTPEDITIKKTIIIPLHLLSLIPQSLIILLSLI